MYCILLFNIFLEVALVLDRNKIGADITGHCISHLRFADDISLMAGSTDDLQQLANKVYTTSDKCGLRVSSTKTEVQYIGRVRQEMKFMLGNNELVQCEDFIYLGSHLSGFNL